MRSAELNFMDRKTIPIVIACIVMIYLLGLLSNKIYPPIPIPKSANTNVVASAAATNVSTQTATNAPPGTVAAAQTCRSARSNTTVRSKRSW